MENKKETKYRAFYLSIYIIKFVKKLSRKSEDRIIVEAKSSASKREFLNYFQIALKSANESKYWLAMLKELHPEFPKEIDSFLKEIEEIGKIIGSSILTMKGKKLLNL